MLEISLSLILLLYGGYWDTLSFDENTEIQKGCSSSISKKLIHDKVKNQIQFCLQNLLMGVN